MSDVPVYQENICLMLNQYPLVIIFTAGNFRRLMKARMGSRRGNSLVKAYMHSPHMAYMLMASVGCGDPIIMALRAEGSMPGAIVGKGGEDAVGVALPGDDAITMEDASDDDGVGTVTDTDVRPTTPAVLRSAAVMAAAAAATA